jgi:hypothetical protein
VYALDVVAAHADRCERLLAEIRAEFPRFRLRRKDSSTFQRAIHWGLCTLTMGRMRRYLTRYQTTIGNTVWVTPDFGDWDADERYVVLRHELVHLRQFRRYGLVGMALLYLLLPLPIGLAYFRARFEMEGYRETLHATAAVRGVAAVRDPALREWIVGQFTGPAYGWMWPFKRSVERWYDSELAAAVTAAGGARA